MEQDVIRINRWNMAGKYGLVFGLISVAYLYYGHLTVVLGMTGFVSSALGFIIWAAICWIPPMCTATGFLEKGAGLKGLLAAGSKAVVRLIWSSAPKAGTFVWIRRRSAA